MKRFVIAVTILTAICAQAARAPKLTPEEKEAQRAAARQRLMEETGGIIDRPGTGRLAVVNCQKKIGADAVETKIAEFNKVLRVDFNLIDGAWSMAAGVPEGYNAALYIVDDATLPMTLVAAEARWGVLNVAALDAGPRFNKAFVRAAIMTFGAGVSQFRGSPMQTVTKPEDLDKILKDGVTFDALTSVLRNLEAIGVTQPKKTTYRKAVMEGWAAQPTNDYQKVIWEEVHAEPTNPMKITFDPAKGE